MYLWMMRCMNISRGYSPRGLETLIARRRTSNEAVSMKIAVDWKLVSQGVPRLNWCSKERNATSTVAATLLLSNEAT
jgi:hypothetical protein